MEIDLDRLEFCPECAPTQHRIECFCCQDTLKETFGVIHTLHDAMPWLCRRKRALSSFLSVLAALPIIASLLAVARADADAGCYSSMLPSKPILPTICGLLVAKLLWNFGNAKGDKIRNYKKQEVEMFVEKHREFHCEVLSRALRCQTVSYNKEAGIDRSDFGEFERLRNLLKSSFPKCRDHLTWTAINGESLLLKWKGKGKEALKPIMFCAHLDVVPAGEGEWNEEPFGGVLKDGCVWGRGAIDNKHNIVGVLGAIERLLGEGFEPDQTIYVALGHDEEIGGGEGESKSVDLYL